MVNKTAGENEKPPLKTFQGVRNKSGNQLFSGSGLAVWNLAGEWWNLYFLVCKLKTHKSIIYRFKK